MISKYENIFRLLNCISYSLVGYSYRTGQTDIRKITLDKGEALAGVTVMVKDSNRTFIKLMVIQA